MPRTMTDAEFVLHARKKLGTDEAVMTQEELAQLTGYTQGGISQIENGQSSMTGLARREIERALVVKEAQQIVEGPNRMRSGRSTWQCGHGHGETVAEFLDQLLTCPACLAQAFRTVTGWP